MADSDTGEDSSGADTNGTGDVDTEDGGDGDGGAKFDLPVPDAPEEQPPTMPTCDNIDQLGPTSVGCEFWATDVPVMFNGGEGAAGQGMGVGVGNPWDQEVTVTIVDSRGWPGGFERVLGEVVLGPRESEIIEINVGEDSLLPGEDHTPYIGENKVSAFVVRSDAPITAMQITPIGGAPGYVPEASLLLPTNALGTAYMPDTYQSFGPHSGFVIVVATEDGTEIDFTNGNAPVKLDAFDSYRFQVAPTGFRVDANKPVAVFAGTLCTFIPAEAGWCDHLEEQVIPLSAWGTHYVGARHPQRTPELHPEPEDVYWRVMAATDDTTINFTPPQPDVGDQLKLDKAGDWFEFKTTEHFVAQSAEDKPFMLNQYMMGGEFVSPEEDCIDGPPIGDPFMMQTMPVEQWIELLPFITDESYARDFAIISREAGTTVELSCFGVIPDDRFEAIPGTSFEVASIDLDTDHDGGEGNCSDGQQFIEADGPVGVSVGGVDCAASYGYPGGGSFSSLWVPPDPAG